MSTSNTFTISDIYTVEAFNALIDFSEAELQLLENYRTFFASRIKTDREYGQSLSKITRANKSSVVGAFVVEKVKLFVEKSLTLYKSLILLKKLWNSMNDDASSFSSRLIDSCDSLRVNLIPRIEILIREKKDARKRLDKEKSRLLNDLKRLRDSVESCKSQYNQQLQLILQYRKEYREQGKSLTSIS
jgi:hypothetical protein